MPLHIKTNHHERQFVYRYDVPQDILERWFDYQDPEETIDGFFEYRGHWYHVDQFMRLRHPSPEMGEWDGYAADGFASGVVIKISDDGETFKVGTYFSTYA